MTVPRLEELVRRQAAARPSACAVEGTDGRGMSYQELWDRAGRFAVSLGDLGAGRGSVVAIALDRSPGLVISMLAAARAGATYVLLDPLSPAARNALLVAETGAVVIVRPAGTQPWTPAAGIVSLTVPEAGTAAAELAANPAGDPQDPLYIAYTSGSTGRPKGVIASHRAVAHFCTEPLLCELGPGDRVASLSNPASDATTLEIWRPLVAGASIVVLPAAAELDAGDWRPMLRERGVTVMFLMAGLLDLISREDPGAFASLRTLIFGGEALPPECAVRVLRDSPPERLVLGYGPTETTVFATMYECVADEIAGRDRIPLGFALGGYSLYITDSERRLVDSGQTGELCIGGPAVGGGYLARPNMTAERFVWLEQVPEAGVVYRSGDLVRRLTGGELEFVGRADRQVKLRGFRIELEEVEQGVLATGLVSGAVVERSQQGGRPHLVCFFVPAAPDPAAAEAELSVRLAAATAQRLPGYMIPARWVALTEFPRNSIGKVDRARLLARVQD